MVHQLRAQEVLPSAERIRVRACGFPRSNFDDAPAGFCAQGCLEFLMEAAKKVSCLLFLHIALILDPTNQILVVPGSPRTPSQKDASNMQDSHQAH